MSDPFFAGAQLAFGVGSSILSARSERRARNRAKEEAKQARKALRETSESQAGLVLDTAAGAAAPLERMADVASMDLRSPLMRDALSQGLRQQAEAESVRANLQSGATTGRRRAGEVLLNLLTSRGLGAAEQARVERARQNLSLRAQLLRESGAIRTEGARSAANIRTSAASQIAGISAGTGPSTAIAGGLGGFSSALGQLSGEDKEALSGLFSELFKEDPFVSSHAGKALDFLGLDAGKFASDFRAAYPSS